MFTKTLTNTKVYTKSLLLFIISQWFFLAIGLFILLAYLFPNFACKGGMIKSEYSINYGAVGVIFLLSGLTMNTKQLLRMIGAWKCHLFCQIFSFLVTSSIIFGFAKLIITTKNSKINDYVLVGFIVTGATPTTVSSNVVMTKEASGNDTLALIEVVIGNVLGAFISPLIVQMYLSRNTGFYFANPTSDIQLSLIYGKVMKNMAISVFAPLIVGQLIQKFIPKITQYIKKYKIGKVGSFCLLLMIFSSFSTAFKEDAFELLEKESIILIVFFNIGIYVFFTFLCLFFARLPFLPEDSMLVKHLRFNKKDTVALMLCTAAKTIALGIPLINAQWGEDAKIMGIVSIPLVLYQAEQLVVANFMVPVMKKWIYQDETRTIEENEVEISDIHIEESSTEKF